MTVGIRDASVWRTVMSVRLPSITSRGEVEGSRVVGLREESLGLAEAEALARVLLELVEHGRMADEVIRPHLLAAVQAAEALYT